MQLRYDNEAKTNLLIVPSPKNNLLGAGKKKRIDSLLDQGGAGLIFGEQVINSLTSCLPQNRSIGAEKMRRVNDTQSTKNQAKHSQA